MPQLPPGHSLDASTLPSIDESESSRSGRGTPASGLVLLWSRDEPERVGEILFLPPGQPGPWIFGRGAAGGGAQTLSLVRDRPGARTAGAPLACPRISRRQLRLSALSGGGVLVENIGRCSLWHLGREVERAELNEGETFSLHNELLFLCVRRPPMAGAPDEESGFAHHPFGEPDTLGLVGESPLLWNMRRQIATVARQPYHVLVLGPSGSGKELIAQAIHACSPRSRRAMVARNAATIPEGLADAELFGNIRNYPNPGMPDRPGIVGQAHGSTLFLDEFAELPHTLQAHLLRLMDHGEYQRLGEATPRTADLRIVAATNRSASHLKHDVLARLKLTIVALGLDERKEDIPLLLVHLLRKHAAADPVIRARFFPDGDTRAHPRISPLLVEALVHHRYTGHVRELDAMLVRATLEARGKYVDVTPDLARSAPYPGRSQYARAERQRVLEHQQSSEPNESAAPHDDEGEPRADVLLVALSGDERTRLARLRVNRFSPTACGRDPDYPGNRQTADFHFRQLVCAALPMADWDLGRAASLLAGSGDENLQGRVGDRIATFISNLRERSAANTPNVLEKALADEWKGSVDLVLAVVGAMRAGRL